MQWYYIHKGRQGPVPIEKIKALLEDGTLNSQTKVWHAKMGSQWKRVTLVPEFGGDPEAEVGTEGEEKKSGLRFSTTIRRRRKDENTNISRGNVEFASVSTVEAAHRGASLLIKLREKARWWYIVAAIVLVDFMMMHFHVPVPDQMGILAGFGFLEYAYEYSRGNISGILTLVIYYGAPALTIGLFMLTGRLAQSAVIWLYLVMGLVIIGDLVWLLLIQEWVAAIIHAMVLHPLISGYAYGKRYTIRN